MATANRPPVPVPPNLAKIKDPDTRMALQAIMDGWSVRNGWVGSGDNKFLTKADLEGYLSDPANAAFLSQVTGASGGSGGSGSGNGGLAYDQIKELSDWIKTTWLWKTLHELIPDIYSNTGLKKAVETLTATVGVVQQSVTTVAGNLVNLFTLLGVTNTNGHLTISAGKYENFDAYLDGELTAFAKDENGVFAAAVGQSNTSLAAVVDVTKAVTGATLDTLTKEKWPIAVAVTKAASKITTLETSDEKNRNALEQALLVTDNTASGVVMAYTLRANVVNKNEGAYTAGFGFSVERIGGELRSIFLVGADTFAVYDPAKSTNTNYVLPFMVNNGTVYINDAMVATLTADKIKGDVNKIMPVRLDMQSWSFPPGRQPGVNWRIIGTQSLPANMTHGHTHFAMVTVVGSIPSTPDGLRIQVKIVDDNGRDSTVYGYSYTDTKGSVTVSVAGSERSYVGATLQVYALAEFKPGTIDSVGGICGGLR